MSSLPEMFETWRAWNQRNVVADALRRADAAGQSEQADQLRRALAKEPAVSAVEALAAQHELAELLSGWRWHTVAAAREQGATWDDIAAATSTDPQVAREAYREQVERAQNTADEIGIPLRDAGRYQAAARDDTDIHDRDQTAGTADAVAGDTSQEHPTVAEYQDDDSDQRPEFISGPDLDDDGLVIGEIALPGGLPPDEEDDDVDDVPRWDEAFEIADRDGYVLFDPTTPGGFRALTTDEHRELTDSIRTSTPADLAARDDDHALDQAESATAAGAEQEHKASLEAVTAPDQGLIHRVGDMRGTSAGLPTAGEQRLRPAEKPGWLESDADPAGGERAAVEDADTVGTVDDSGADDTGGLPRGLDDLRMQLTGYTWRQGVDRDEALADRREQLGRWYDDDHLDDDDGHGSSDPGDGSFPGRGQCLIDDDDPRWHQ